MNDTINGGSGADDILFSVGDGADEIRFFNTSQDRLILELAEDDAPGSDTPTGASVMQTFGSVEDGNIVLSFLDGSGVTFRDITDEAAVAAAIEIELM